MAGHDVSIAVVLEFDAVGAETDPMKYRAVVRFQSHLLLRYFGAPWIRPAVGAIFNRWTVVYGTEWEDVRWRSKTIGLLPR